MQKEDSLPTLLFDLWTFIWNSDDPNASANGYVDDDYVFFADDRMPRIDVSALNDDEAIEATRLALFGHH